MDELKEIYDKIDNSENIEISKKNKKLGIELFIYCLRIMIVILLLALIILIIVWRLS